MSATHAKSIAFRVEWIRAIGILANLHNEEEIASYPNLAPIISNSEYIYRQINLNKLAPAYILLREIQMQKFNLFFLFWVLFKYEDF
ncbi:MAG: hypothetical protein EA343_12010 [Nodularia sp. (in: Bacteria)]|nr:MAG: hypothetical protein EA343_12010 [Nodularia sp. (in: cyanobacteria)]